MDQLDVIASLLDNWDSHEASSFHLILLNKQG